MDRGMPCYIGKQSSRWRERHGVIGREVPESRGGGRAAQAEGVRPALRHAGLAVHEGRRALRDAACEHGGRRHGRKRPCACGGTHGEGGARGMDAMLCRVGAGRPLAHAVHAVGVLSPREGLLQASDGGELVQPRAYRGRPQRADGPCVGERRRDAHGGERVSHRTRPCRGGRARGGWREDADAHVEREERHRVRQRHG